MTTATTEALRLTDRINRIEPSATMAVVAEAEKLRSQGIDVVDFGAGEPHFATPQHIKDAAVAAIQGNFTKYTAVAGTAELRDAIAHRHNVDFDSDYRREDSEIELVGEYGSGAEAVSAIPHLKPDLLFMDVQMPECDGFDVLEMLGTATPPVVVFVTAFDEYAIRAFEAGAQDYILKPFDNARLERALGRAKQRLSQMNGTPRRPERLAIKSLGEICFVKISDIDWIEAADYYACLHVAGKSHLLRRSLSDLEKELDSGIFCRIHRSAIVNLDQVSGLQIGEDGENELVLKNGVQLRLSRRYRKQFQSRLGVHD